MTSFTYCLQAADLSMVGRPLLEQTQAQWWQATEGGAVRAYTTVRPQASQGWTQLVAGLLLDGASAGELARFHYVVETDIAEPAQEEFNAWYDTEHLPGLARVPGTIRARRFVRSSGGPQFVACYELVSAEVMQSAPWLAIRHTPWSDRVRPWFTNTQRTLYTPLLASAL